MLLAFLPGCGGRVCTTQPAFFHTEWSGDTLVTHHYRRLTVCTQEDR